MLIDCYTLQVLSVADCGMRVIPFNLVRRHMVYPTFARDWKPCWYSPVVVSALIYS